MFFDKIDRVECFLRLTFCNRFYLQIFKAIKELPQLCKDNKEHTPKIADILAQLLLSEDTLELQQVHLSLQTLAKYDIVGTLTGVFNQISAGDEGTRSKSLEYLSTKFIKNNPELITPEVEKHIITELKKIMQDVSADEFHACLQILAKTKMAKTVTGHSELVQICIEQADLNVQLSGSLAAEDEVVERFIFCATEAIPYLSKTIESTPFVKFMCEKLMPLSTWNLIGAADDQSQTQLRLLKVFAECCTYCGTLEKAEKYVEAIYNVLLEYMPVPPLDADLTETPSFQFSHAECLLYALHILGRQAPDYLKFTDDAQKLKDFRTRLTYLARGTQGYLKKLQEALKGKIPAELRSEENQIKVTALKTTSNITTLIRDLFHTPPSFKSKITLSWLASDKSEKEEGALKRKNAISFDNANAKKANKSSAQVYSPPSGKYSSNVAYQQKTGGGGGGGRRGGNFRSGRRFNRR